MKQIFITSDGQQDNISYFELEPAILVSMKRKDLPYLKEQEFANYSAIYVLIGGNKRYVGQAAGQTITQRLSQHFTNPEKDWADSVIFFSRYDGKMSKAETDYLEKRLIEDFKEKSDFDLTNSTAGNTSYIDRLQSAKSKQLYDAVFQIINEIADIDLFGANDELNVDIKDENPSDTFEIEFDGKTIDAPSARGLFIGFVKSVIADSKYQDALNELIVDEAPSFKMILGKKEHELYGGKPASVEVGNGVWLYFNLSKKATKDKIEKLAKDLGIDINLKWK